MTWETFVETCRLGGREYRILWQSEFSFDSENRLVSDDRGIVAFASETEARAYALTLGERLAEDEFPRQFYDLDAMAAWCERPDSHALDAGALWRVWNLLEDAGLVTIPVAMPGEPDYADCEAFENLTFSELATDAPESYAAFVRPWRAGELERIADILRPGIVEFGRRLSPR